MLLHTTPVFTSGVLSLVGDASLAAAVAAGGVVGFSYSTVAGADSILAVFPRKTWTDALTAAGRADALTLASYTDAEVVHMVLELHGHIAFDRVEVISLDPVSGSDAGGTSVTITGSGFSVASAGTPTVTFGGVAATSIVVVSNTSITCDTPAGTAGDVDVVVTNANGTHTLADGFEFTAA